MKQTFILFLVSVLSAPLVLPQTPIDSLGSEALFFRARDLAFDGRRDSARILLKKALAKSPAYADIRILLARTYAWDGMRNDARKELKTVLNDNPDYRDALSAAIDVELWDDQYEAALALCNTALRHHSNNEEFLVKRAKAFRALNRDAEALNTIDMLEDVNRSNPEIQPLRESIALQSMNQYVSAGYTYDRFSVRFDPQHLVALQYGRSTAYGSVIGRVHIAQKFGGTALQYEIDAYPPIVDGLYGFFNYGYSSSSLFPQHRIGMEGFFKLPHSFEGSLGFRYLSFGPGSSVTMYTGSLGYYYGNYWFSLRPYITPGNVSFSRSISLTTRRYFGGDGDYASLKIGVGASPDEDRYVDTLGANLYNLKAQTIGIGYQYVITIYSTLNFTADYTNQELSRPAGTFMKITSIYIGYKYKF